MSLQAAQGKQAAQRHLLDLVTGVEGERRRNRDLLFETTVEYQIDARARIKETRRLGRDEPEFLPRPDDLIIDPLTGSVISKGPWTREEKAELEGVRKLKSEIEAELAFEQSQPAGKRKHKRIATLKSVINRCDEVLNFERVILPPRAG